MTIPLFALQSGRTSNVYTWYGYDARHPHAVNNIKGGGGTAGKTLTVRAKATCPGSY